MAQPIAPIPSAAAAEAAAIYLAAAAPLKEGGASMGEHPITSANPATLPNTERPRRWDANNYNRRGYNTEAMPQSRRSSGTQEQLQYSLKSLSIMMKSI